PVPGVCLPRGEGQPRTFATHCRFTQLVARQSELAVIATWPTGGLAPIAQAHGAGITGQSLQLLCGSETLLWCGLRILYARLDGSTPGGIFCHHATALCIARDHAFLCHRYSPGTCLVAEREVETVQQGPPFFVAGRTGGYDNIHAANRIDLVIVDLREHDLLAYS